MRFPDQKAVTKESEEARRASGGVNAARFSLQELDAEADREEERRARLRPSSLWPGARPDPTQGDGEEGAGRGAHFPGRIPRTRRRPGFSR